MRSRRFNFSAAVLCLLFLATACATSSGKKAFRAEELLVPAGFTYHVARTPEMLARMKQLPARKMIRHMRHGKPLYLYQDVAGCKCVWVGDEAAYEHFKEFFHEAKLDRRQANKLWTERYAYSRIIGPDKVDAFIDQNLPGF